MTKAQAKRLAALYRHAAELADETIGLYRRGGCLAIHRSAKNENERLFAARAFAEVFAPKGSKRIGYWFGPAYGHGTKFDKAQQHRVMALLLMAELAEDQA